LINDEVYEDTDDQVIDGQTSGMSKGNLKDLRGDFKANRELRDDVAALRSVDLGQ
jgi:hypothetical protein